MNSHSGATRTTPTPSAAAAASSRSAVVASSVPLREKKSSLTSTPKLVVRLAAGAGTEGTGGETPGGPELGRAAGARCELPPQPDSPTVRIRSAVSATERLQRCPGSNGHAVSEGWRHHATQATVKPGHSADAAEVIVHLEPFDNQAGGCNLVA